MVYLFTVCFVFATTIVMLTHLPYPEKNRVDAKKADQHKNDNAPFANPKWVLLIEGKKNIR